MNFNNQMIGYPRHEAPPDPEPTFCCSDCKEPIEDETFVELNIGNYHVSCVREWIDSRIVTV